MSIGIIKSEDLAVAKGCGISFLVLAGLGTFGLKKCTKDEIKITSEAVEKISNTPDTSNLYTQLQDLGKKGIISKCLSDITDRGIQSEVRLYIENGDLYSVKTTIGSVQHITRIIITSTLDSDVDGKPDYIKTIVTDANFHDRKVIMKLYGGPHGQGYKLLDPKISDDRETPTNYQIALKQQKDIEKAFEGYDMKTCTPPGLKYLGE